MYRYGLTLITVILLVGAFAGCGHPYTPPSTVIVPADADSIAENLLVAISSPNYADYIKYFRAGDPGMKDEIFFTTSVNLYKSRIGTYKALTKILTNVEQLPGSIDITYKAKFTLEDEVTVIIGITTDNGTTYTTGIWLNSPKLNTPQ